MTTPPKGAVLCRDFRKYKVGDRIWHPAWRSGKVLLIDTNDNSLHADFGIYEDRWVWPRCGQTYRLAKPKPKPRRKPLWQALQSVWQAVARRARKELGE